MKELSIEEKANAYDEALKAAVVAHKDEDKHLKATLERIFPELKESEDEKIRKGILELVRQSSEILDKQNQNKMIAWLDMQGKKMSDPRYSILDKLIEADDIYQMSVNAEMIETAKNKAIDTLSKLEISKLLELEKQGERKTPQWMIDFLDNYRRNIGCSLDHDEAKDVDGKILCIKEWLENQGEQKPTDTCDSSMIDKKKSPYTEKRKFSYLSEKTSVNNIGPLFHIGDWVVRDMSDGRKVIRQIDNMTKKSYILDGEKFNTFYFEDLENDYHLWTIQDAKDGDVLAVEAIEENYQYPFVAIYKEHGLDFFNSYCFIGFDGKFYKADAGHSTEEIHPATKEQRDLLFAKMKEAGYEWDVNKKQLERIIDEKQIKKNLQDNSFRRMFEQNPAWSEEDEKRIENILRVLDVQVCWSGGGKVNPYQKEIDWLKYLKNRVEVKDVDLGAEISHYINQHQSEFKGYDNIRRVAGHFLELGSKARKG